MPCVASHNSDMERRVDNFRDPGPTSTGIPANGLHRPAQGRPHHTPSHISGAPTSESHPNMHSAYYCCR